MYLTEKGITIGQRIIDISNEAVNSGSQGMNDDERELLYKSLDLIANNLKKICDNYGGKNGN